MHNTEYRDGVLCIDGVRLNDIVSAHGSPCYVYSRQVIETQWQNLDQAFASHPHLICYAVKANSNLAILNVLARLGSGFDIVSVGELERVLKAGGDAAKVVFSGVGKTAEEMQRALEVGIKCFNVESISELKRLNKVAGTMGQQAPVSLRVNPDVDAKTHPYIATGLKENKFGISFEQAQETYLLADSLDHIDVVGIDCHIGSQITELAPFVDALQRVMALVDELAEHSIHLHHIDLGGGLGIQYQEEEVPSAAAYSSALLSQLQDKDFEILIEPGRSIVGNAGVLITRVEYLKMSEDHNFAIVDAAMNDLMRPSLYSAWHDIIPVSQQNDAEMTTYDIVGPICETGDFLGKQRQLALREGDLIAVCSAGAYGSTMSSNYNTRPRVVELMVDGDSVHVIRQREQLQELFAHEHLLP